MRRHHISRQADRGSILIDLLVGTSILASGLFIIWLSLASIAETTARDSQLADARLVLMAQLETLRGTTFSSLVTGSVDTDVSTLPSGMLTTNIIPVSDIEHSIELSLTWQGQTGPRTVGAATRITSGGLGGN